MEQYTYIYIFTVYKMTAKYSLLRQLTLFSFLYNHLRNNIAYVNNGYIKDMKIILWYDIKGIYKRYSLGKIVLHLKYENLPSYKSHSSRYYDTRVRYYSKSS